jgi:hypothetical protein
MAGSEALQLLDREVPPFSKDGSANRLGPRDEGSGTSTVEVEARTTSVDAVDEMVTDCVVSTVLSGVAAVCTDVIVVDPVATEEQALDNREGDQVLAEAGV